MSLGLFVASMVAAAIIIGGAPFVSPFSPAGEVTAFYQGHSIAVRVTAMLQFGSAVPLGIYAATVYARLLRLGVRVPGPGIGFFGGSAAAVFMMISGLTTWLLSRPTISADVVVTHALSFLAFLAGGVAFAVGIGLLLAGIAVPSLILRFLPRWLSWTGLVIAALAEISVLSMVVPPLRVLLPVARFGGLLWLVIAGFMLPLHRSPANRMRQQVPGGEPT